MRYADFAYRFDTWIKTSVLLLFMIVIAILTGISVDSGSLVIPVALVALIVFTFIYTIFGRGGDPEAVLLGLLTFGYIVGNRGFAAVSLSDSAPLYVGEVTVMACFATFVFRMAFTKGRLVPPNSMGWTVAVFLMIGVVRFAVDVYQAHPRSFADVRDIARDFAMVYYAAVFFIAYHIGLREGSRRFFVGILNFAFILLLPSFALPLFFPEIYNSLSVRGTPLIFHKGDLASAFLAAGSIYFFVTSKRSGHPWLWIFLSMGLFWLFAYGPARAALVGLIAADCFLLLARRGQIVKYQAIYAVIGIIAVLLITPIFKHSNEDSILLRVAEKTATIFDVFGTAHYRLDSSASSLQNTRFRQVWWQNVYDETMEKSPIFGLGFGYDISARFLRNYPLPLGDDFDARSPHSYLFSMFGRLGLVGLLAFLAIVFQIVLLAFRYAAEVRKTKTFGAGLALWTALIIILLSACFGVVLEGPMAAIPFWIFLGLVASEKFARSHTTTGEQKKNVPPRFIEPPLSQAEN